MCKEYIREAYAKGIPLQEIADALGTTKSAIKSKASRDPECPTHGSLLQNRGKNENAIIGTNGSLTMESKMRDASKVEQSRIEKLLEKNGYRPQWGIAWAHLEDEGVKTTVLLKNPQEIEQEEEWREQFLKEVRKVSPRHRAPKKKKVTDGHLHLIDIADLHIGKAAYSHDGTPLYNIEKAVAIAHEAVASHLQYGSQYNIEQFILPIGNDVLHVDSKYNSTTKGTHQDTDKMWTHMVDAAFWMYVTIAQDLAKIAPVKIIHCRDNHAEHLSYMLAKMVAAYLHNNGNVTADISRLDRMYHVYGKNLIGLDHGHGTPSKELQAVVSSEQRREWGLAEHCTFVRHHIHHAVTEKKTVKVLSEQTLKDYAGMTVMYMRSPSGTDDYHHNAGYVGGRKAIDSIIFHPEFGQVAHLSAPF